MVCVATALRASSIAASALPTVCLRLVLDFVVLSLIELEEQTFGTVSSSLYASKTGVWFKLAWTQDPWLSTPLHARGIQGTPACRQAVGVADCVLRMRWECRNANLHC